MSRSFAPRAAWRARGRSIVAAAAALLVALDALVAAWPTAVLAVLAVVVGTVVMAADGVRAIRARLAGRWFAALLAVVAGFGALRAWVFVRQMGDPVAAAPAAVTYDVVWLALAGGTAAALWAQPRIAPLVRAVWSRPRRVLSGSFALLVLVTSVLLTLPVSVRDVHAVSILDALFTATSAVCVTGLAVHDLGKTYTPFGQGVLLLAIQLGGIGIMTIAAFAVTVMRAAVSRESRYARMLDAENIEDLRSMVRAVVVGTIAFESLGALALWGLWSGRDDLDGHSALWLAVFHSVSSFCNGGISIFSDSLARFSHDAPTQLVIMALVLVGGLGFPVWRGLSVHAGRRAWHLVKKGAPRPVHFDLGTRVALVTSAVLVVAGFVAFLILEWGGAMRGFSIPAKVLNALFTSVIVRTGGFTTFGYELVGDATLIFVMVFMFIGGSPGSTAGGVKTTTVAIIFAALRSELRGDDTTLLGRALDDGIVRRAISVVTIGLAVILCALFALTITEDLPFKHLLFEVFAAFSTAGLSMGVTPQLSAAGKVVILLTMFAGRVGPLTLALALGTERRRPLHHLPTETLPVG